MRPSRQSIYAGKDYPKPKQAVSWMILGKRYKLNRLKDYAMRESSRLGKMLSHKFRNLEELDRVFPIEYRLQFPIA